MNLESALSITGSGLAVVQRQIAVLSQNVANASTTGYVREVSTQTSLTADSEPSGVRSGPTLRALDEPLQASLLSQNATVSGLQVRSAALSAVDAAQGTVGAGGSSLSSLAGALQDSFTTLRTDPSSAAQQQAVLTAAQGLAGGINALSQTYTTQRQAAQDSVVQQVTVVNQTLAEIGSTSDRIITLRSEGVDTADLENQRDEQVASLSSLVSVHAKVSRSGDMSITTDDGTNLPTRGLNGAPLDGPLSTGSITIAPGDMYAAGSPTSTIPAIRIGTQDVTDSLTGGSIGANITLRDTTLPGYQASLDGYSKALATGFSGQNLALFTSGSGAVLGAGSAVGLSASIQVNSMVLTTPSLVRDGTAGGTTTEAGNTTIIDGVLNTTFAPTGSSPGLVAQAASLVASQSQDSAASTAALGTETGVQTTLNSQFDTSSGVDVDQELSNMVGLQNAYGAGGKIISAIETMFNSLLAAVNP